MNTTVTNEEIQHFSVPPVGIWRDYRSVSTWVVSKKVTIAADDPKDLDYRPVSTWVVTKRSPSQRITAKAYTNQPKAAVRHDRVSDS